MVCSMSHSAHCVRNSAFQSRTAAVVVLVGVVERVLSARGTAGRVERPHKRAAITPCFFKLTLVGVNAGRVEQCRIVRQLLDTLAGVCATTLRSRRALRQAHLAHATNRDRRLLSSCCKLVSTTKPRNKHALRWLIFVDCKRHRLVHGTSTGRRGALRPHGRLALAHGVVAPARCVTATARSDAPTHH